MQHVASYSYQYTEYKHLAMPNKITLQFVAIFNSYVVSVAVILEYVDAKV